LLAGQNVDAATTLAMWGKIPSEIERLLHDYYIFYDTLQKAIAGEKTWAWEFLEIKKIPITKESQLEAFERITPMRREKLISIFVDALNRRDYDKIHEIAYGVEFLKEWDRQQIEKSRAGILLARSSLEKGHGCRLNIQQMAKLIKWSQSDTRDGLSQLRRLCRELGYPLAASRQIRSK
jgi:hypothetical protein